MSYRTSLVTVAADSETRAVGVFRRYVDGALTVPETTSFIAAIIAHANSRATSLADLAVTAAVMLATRQPVPVIGLLPPPGDLERLHKAAGTVLDVADNSADPDAIVGRLARSEPLETGNRAASEAMNKQPAVEGWVRDTGGDCCELCEWWSRDGQVWPADHEMPTHKGCTCTPDPVVREQNSEEQQHEEDD